MGKRESRQKSRQSVAIRGEKKRVKGDRDKIERLTKTVEAIKLLLEICSHEWGERYVKGARYVIRNIEPILNGTERKGESE